MHWMVEHCKAEFEHRKHGPPLATGKPKWDEQNANQARGLSHSGKNPASAIGQPYVVCSHYHARQCGGWASLEALATNPF
eukprot:5898278-Karenia_brevis.AAC.1